MQHNDHCSWDVSSDSNWIRDRFHDLILTDHIERSNILDFEEDFLVLFCELPAVMIYRPEILVCNVDLFLDSYGPSNYEVKHVCPSAIFEEDFILLKIACLDSLRNALQLLLAPSLEDHEVV